MSIRCSTHDPYYHIINKLIHSKCDGYFQSIQLHKSYLEIQIVDNLSKLPKNIAKIPLSIVLLSIFVLYT